MYIIDRFEGNYAVVESDDDMVFQLPRTLIPDAREGDIIRISVTVDMDETAKRLENIKKMMENFFDE